MPSMTEPVPTIRPAVLRAAVLRHGWTIACAAALLLTACDEDAPPEEDVVDLGADADADADAEVGADADADAGGLIVMTTELPLARVQLDYEVRLDVLGAAGPVTWSLAGGELPPGLALAADGTIAGLAERAGVYEFEVQADDGWSSGRAALSLEVPRVLLLSGFEPFDTFELNSSWEAIVPFAEQLVAGLDVRVVELPVTWAGAWEPLLAEIVRLQPDAVLATGQAGPEGMRFETAARNWMADADNDGVDPGGVPIVEGGESRLRASYPIDELQAAMVAEGFPTLVSANAGAFLCNYVMYRLLEHRAASGDTPPVAGFIHVPPVPSDGGLTLDEITEAHRVGIGALAAWFEAGAKSRSLPPGVERAPQYFF